MKWTFSFLLIALFFGCKTETPTTNATNSEAEQVISKIDYHYEVRQPKVSIDQPPLLILMHGYGSNEKDLFAWADYLDERLLIVCPRGPKDLGKGRYSWFDLRPSEAGLRYESKEVIQTANDIATFAHQIAEKHNVNPNKIFLGGFSQGAILSLGTGVMFEDKFAGIICLSGSFYREFGRLLNQRKNPSSLNVFLSHGRNDTVLPFTEIEDYVKFIRDKGGTVEAKYYDADHSVTTQNLKDMIGWLSKNIDS